MSFFDTPEQSEKQNEYPSRGFFMDRLHVEVQRSLIRTPSVEESLVQLREIWRAGDRESVLATLEGQTRRDYSYQYPDELQAPITDALCDLIAKNHSKRSHRHSADLAISRLVKWLSPENQIKVITPWFESTRKFRILTVMRCLRQVEDVSPHAQFIVRNYREYPETDFLKLIGRTPAAAAMIFQAELDTYFERYIQHFKSDSVDARFPDRITKYHAMLAAKVLINGGHPVPKELQWTMPEIFSWAIDELGDRTFEPLLIELIEENRSNPELLWSAIRTAHKLDMTIAIARGVETARRLLWVERRITVSEPESGADEFRQLPLE